MKIHDCETRVTPVEIEYDHPLELVTWVTINGEHIARVQGVCVEISACGATRGEAMTTLADALKQIGKRVAMLAFEQEGVTGLTRGEMSP